MGNVKEVREEIEHVIVEFQLGDMKRAISAKANFLVALGLMVSTEFLGGLISGTLGQHKWEGDEKRRNSIEEYRFEEGFKYLGNAYTRLLEKHNNGVLDIYRTVRCGLIHQYLPEQTEGIYTGSGGGAGIVESDGKLKIMVDDYIRDLENAVIRLLSRLETESTLLQRCRNGLHRIPKLV